MYDISMSNRWVGSAGWVTVVAGIGLMVVHFYGGSAGSPEGWFAAAGFAAPIVGAGALCLVGDRMARPLLCVAAGIGLAIMSVVSIVMFPLLIAATIMFAEARNVTGKQETPVVPFVLAAALVSVFGFLIFHQDPATWSTPDGGGGSSNIVTNVEASVSLGVVAIVVLGSVFWAQRIGRRRDLSFRSRTFG